jgi:FAD/FMN-containing dehydrogenase
LVNFDTSLPSGTSVRSSIRAYFFGHIGDSSLHVSVDVRSDPGVAHATTIAPSCTQCSNRTADRCRAERGIDLLKRVYLPLTRSPEEIVAMRAIKALLDPKGILDSGHVV